MMNRIKNAVVIDDHPEWRDTYIELLKRENFEVATFSEEGGAVEFLDKNESHVAIVHFREALRLKPNYAKVHSNLGAALVRQGKFQEALEHLHTALQLKPDDSQTHRNLQICLKLIKQNKN